MWSKDERQRLVVVGGGQITGGRRTTLVYEVGSGCTKSELTTMNATYGRDVGGRRIIVRSREADETGGMVRAKIVCNP